MRKLIQICLITCFILTTSSWAMSQEMIETDVDSTAQEKVVEPIKAMYVGVKACLCHSKTQAKKWKTGPHIGAYKTLASEAAQAIADSLGIEGSPQEAVECLRCHTTAFGVDESRIGKKFTIEDGVQCEACHGAGENYKKKSTMQAIHAAEGDAKIQIAAAVGFIPKPEETCVPCHNDESPTYKGFDYEEYFPKIAHPNPPK